MREHAEGWEARAEFWRDVEAEAAEDALLSRLTVDQVLARMAKRGESAARLLRAIRTAEEVRP